MPCTGEASKPRNSTSGWRSLPVTFCKLHARRLLVERLHNCRRLLALDRPGRHRRHRGRNLLDVDARAAERRGREDVERRQLHHRRRAAACGQRRRADAHQSCRRRRRPRPTHRFPLSVKQRRRARAWQRQAFWAKRENFPHGPRRRAPIGRGARSGRPNSCGATCLCAAASTWCSPLCCYCG